MTVLRFDAATHTYMYGSRNVRSVTGIIKAAGLLGDAAKYYSTNAADRGTRVHSACLCWDKHEAVEMTKEEAPYLDSYKRWSDLCQPIWTSMEEPRHSERLDFAGTADRVGIMHDRPVMVDMKTGGASSWHGIQLALYDILYDEMPPMIRRRLVVHLRRDGGVPHVVEYQNRNDYSVAFTLLAGENNARHNDTESQTEP